ncbi:MAG: zinc-ribbon domain-containing protein [Candidatus Hodarchaeota archaeon]
MYCDSCGALMDDDATFCSKCGQQLVPQKTPVDVPKPTRTPHYVRRKRDEDFLCFGEEREDNPYVGGIILICVGLFLAVIFFDLDEIIPIFRVEYLLVLGFILFGIIVIIQGMRKGK